MKYTAVAVYNDIIGRKFHRRGLLTGQELKVAGDSTPPKEITEKTKSVE
jgi:hypothetical protein